MKHLPRREWNAENCPPLYLVADTRLTTTTYTDDQVWRLRLGQGDSPAVAWQTKYGARANLVSVLPMWTHGDQTVYQATTYHEAPLVTHVASNYVALTMSPLSNVRVLSQTWAMNSQTIGGLYALENTSNTPVTLRLELYAHAVADEKEQKQGIISLPKKRHALSVGNIGNLQPVLLLEGGEALHANGTLLSTSKVSLTVTLNANAKQNLRWVLCSQETIKQSLDNCQQWLSTSWATHIKAIELASFGLLDVSLGDKALDELVELSFLRVTQAFLSPSGVLPHGIPVAHRLPEYGWSARGNGTDYPRSWNGQDPFLAWLIAPVIATVEPRIAEGILLNYLATQTSDGFIELRPSPTGQKTGVLCPPFLAQLAWRIYENTQNIAFLKEVLPKLIAFTEKWYSQDKDNDGLPEYPETTQMGYPFFPTFSTQEWGQGTDIQTTEAPDLQALLSEEWHALHRIAQILNDKKAVANTEKRLNASKDALAQLWNSTRYVYRDRDTHTTPSATALLEDGAGDQEHFVGTKPPAPSRLIVSIKGGVNHTPSATLTLNGTSTDGKPVTEDLPASAFRWQGRQGFATTQHVYADLDRVKAEGLSRVYKIGVMTVGLDALDLNALIPLWTTQPNANTLLNVLTDKKHFWRKNGVSMLSAQHTPQTLANPNGIDGVWLYWNTRFGEALLAQGQLKHANDLLKSLLSVQTQVFKTEQAFSQYYHIEEVKGLGESDHLSGILPLSLLFSALGVWVLSSKSVRVSPVFAWHKAITLKQHGVSIKRSSKSLAIKFPSGYSVTLDGSEWDAQLITDPAPKATVIKPEETRISLPPMVSKRVTISVDHED